MFDVYKSVRSNISLEYLKVSTLATSLTFVNKNCTSWKMSSPMLKLVFVKLFNTNQFAVDKDSSSAIVLDDLAAKLTDVNVLKLVLNVTVDVIRT